MNPLFKGIAANDPKDLILFLLEKMHNELNSPIYNIPDNSKVPNSSNFIEVYKEFVSYFENNNKSIISDEFYFFTNNISTCQYCSTMIHNTQSNNILFFPLEEVRKYKNYRNNIVTILDCFDYYRKEEIYPSFYCNTCKQNYQAKSQTHIIRAPKTLIINFNRGKGLEFNVNIIFEEYLNLRKYVYENNSPYYYELTGVICHFGSNDEGGHFIAYCKNSNNCEWYKYNDQIVTKCYFNEVKGSGLPYVLFYNYVEV
jgi:ubiquitin C-terminal hydrolase